MAKRKADEDFVLTISDNEELPIEEEEIVAEPPKKKSKKAAKSKKKNAKKNTDDDDAEEDNAENDGKWGKHDEDDGAMDSDFEFMVDNAGDIMGDEFAGWGFDGAKRGMNERRVVDVDEIIRRRREKKEGGKKNKKQQKEEDTEADKEVAAAAAAEDDEEVADIDMDDDDDEVLAEDGFGMGAGSDEEESDEDVGDDMDADHDDDEDEDDEEGDASDDDSVATPNDHPDDDGSDSDSDPEEDAEEAAKREAFFAPEDNAKQGKQPARSSFQGLSLSRPILRGLTTVGFTKPTPIQAKTIPIALEGKDVVGGAVTGSGKTGAFIVPILERLLYRPKKVPTTRVVIMTPTRELAIQCHAVATKLASHTDIKFCLAVGGLSLKVQEAELRLRPDVVIATPGRFIDHMRNSASFNVDTVEILVLDEADRMLEDGFADELNEILTTIPKSRQTMLFSATMTSSVDRLVRVGMNKPVRLMVDTQNKTVSKLEQKFIRLRPGREDKRMGYLVHLCKTMYTERVIIFFRQKKEAHRARIIFGLFGLSCAELHGSLNQSQRINAVEDFRDGKVSFLLATDVASRGLDIKGIDTVINYEAPQSLEIYVHRVGRTARAGRAGVAVTIAAEPDRKVVKAAVKAGKAQGAKISSLVIEAADADKLAQQIDDWDDEIEEIMIEEKEEKQLANAEMQIKRGENIMKHEDEIKSRPKRTWFETQNDKKKAKEAGRAELNGLMDSLKKKSGGKLSNKDRKKLDARSDRNEGRAWKKGSAERAGKGAVLNFKKDKSKAKGPGKPKKR
ncbi:nucleolar DEAD-box protein required for synthesis of 60S ribosomal subunit [Neopestalotiopsis sp. 37M]|nr:nucleolar DEAD-box protein required for synthesis of 60S ribosomal subunit [Neopestalotiopsis sp. 37M]